MKKFVLILAAGLMFGGAIMAQDEETGALGLGIISDSSDKGLVGGGIRGSLYLDAGTKLYGPFHYGFEFQGDVKKLDQTSSAFSVTDIAVYYYGNGNAVAFINSTDFTQTYTLWDADLSPRGYISFDLGNKIQLLGFAGLNYNWQTLDYELKSNDGSSFSSPDGSTNDYKKTTTFGDNWSVIAGLRVAVGAFYLDYTRFLTATGSGDLSFNKYNKDRIGLGISLRF